MSILLAAESPQDYFFKQGLLGVVVVVLAGVIYKMFKIILNDRDAAVKQRDQLLEQVFTKVLPAITKNTEILQARQDLDKEIILVIRDSTGAYKDMQTLMSETKYVLNSRRGTAQSGGN